MTKTIWKFELPCDNNPIVVEMPKGAEVLSAGVQDDEIVIWALVSPGRELTQRKFAVFGTGHEVTEDVSAGGLVNTVFMGSLVFHVFEV